MVRFTDGRPDRKLYRAFTIRSLDGKVDDFESIREAVARRYTRVVNEELDRPDLILIDGGKGQLGAARGVLIAPGPGRDARDRAGQEAGGDLHTRPGRAPCSGRGLAFPADTGAVRNESHRFATTLNKKKRAKRVALTLLEAVPGIGQARSKRLMRVFGSMEAIMGATVDEIQKKAGIPRETAAMLLARLSQRYSRPAGAEEARAGRS